MRKVSWSCNAVKVPGIRPADYNKETAFQIYCMTWLRKEFIRTGKAIFSHWHHSPNEGQRTARIGLEMKLMGTSKGFPDLIHSRAKLAVELKLPGETPTPEQTFWLNHFNDIGWTARCITSFEQFKYLIEGHHED